MILKAYADALNLTYSRRNIASLRVMRGDAITIAAVKRYGDLELSCRFRPVASLNAFHPPTAGTQI